MNSFKEIINELYSYNESIFSKIEDDDIMISIKNSLSKLKKIAINEKNKTYIDYFSTLKVYNFAKINISNLINYSFDISKYDKNLSNSFALELTKSKIILQNKLNSLPSLDIPYDKNITNDIIIKVNDIFLSSFINSSDKSLNINLINIKESKFNNLELNNVILDDYVLFMNNAININEKLVNDIKECDINLLFNCKLNKNDINVRDNNIAIQTYNFIPIKYGKDVSELLNIPNKLSFEQASKFLTKKYNTNICLIIDNIVGNDIEYKIPSGRLSNNNININFIEESRTLIYENYISKNDYKRNTLVYGKQKDDSKYIYIRHCDSGKYALMNNKISTNDFIVEYNSVKNLLSNNISNRIHCYYRNENIIQENIFDPDLIMNLNYNIKFVPEVIKLNEFLSFLSESATKSNEYDAESIEEPIVNYFMKLFKNDNYMKNEIRPVIIYLLKRELKMIKRDIFAQKNIDADEYKKIILSYFVDGKFIDRLTSRYNIIYANRKDKDIYVAFD